MTRSAHHRIASSDPINLPFHSEAELKAFLIRQSEKPTRKTFKGIQARATAKKLHQAANR